MFPEMQIELLCLKSNGLEVNKTAQETDESYRGPNKNKMSVEG